MNKKEFDECMNDEQILIRLYDLLIETNNVDQTIRQCESMGRLKDAEVMKYLLKKAKTKKINFLGFDIK